MEPIIVCPASNGHRIAVASSRPERLALVQEQQPRAAWPVRCLSGPLNERQRFRGNRTIPLKWHYTVEDGTVADSAGANPTVSVYGPVACGDTTGGELLEISAAGESGYQYDAATATWQFNWNTRGVPAGCYSIQVTSPQAQPSPLLPIRLE
jgi:hypothetical protein